MSRLATAPARRHAGGARSSTAFDPRPFMKGIYKTPPVRRDNRPYHVAFADLEPQRAKEIRSARRVVFHMLGDTGAREHGGAQHNIANHMAAQVDRPPLASRAAFFFHLGDIIYPLGEELNYRDEFYDPYLNYHARIFAIPGNHDGYTGPASPHSLEAYMKHFCAREEHISSEAAEAGSDRTTVTQPNCYFRLDAVMVTIIGLYSNTNGQLDDIGAGSTEQRDWLADQLADVPKGRCVVLAVHHPPFSLGHHGSATHVQEAIEFAALKAKRQPDAVFSGHEHNYQRFTRTAGGREVPYVIAGAGGHTGYHLDRVHDEDGPPGPNVTLDHFSETQPGFLRVTVDGSTLTSEYFAVPPHERQRDAAERLDAVTLDYKKHHLVR